MDGAAVRVGMDVYDAEARYIGAVTRVYPVPEPYAHGARDFGCFKVRRGPLPFLGPKDLLIPFDAVRASDPERLTLTLAAQRAASARWAMGRQD